MFLFVLQDLDIPDDSGASMAVIVGEDWSFCRILAHWVLGIGCGEGALSEDGDGTMATVVA
jgi:hypothetical protein